MKNKPIVVYEHGVLHIGEQDFCLEDFEALQKYNDLYGRKYFEIGFKKVIFTSYVGVIQIGNKTIEILPKIDNDKSTLSADAGKRKWQSALLHMLKQAGHIRLDPTEYANLQVKRQSLFELYLNYFLKEVEQLIHAGLIKRYSRIRQNERSLCGKLLIMQQVRNNYIHKERFYTEHNTYDTNHSLNGVFKTALEIIEAFSNSTSIRTQAGRLLLYFENIDSWKDSAGMLDKITTDRKSKDYQHPLEIAKMIILGYCPNAAAGQKSVLAFLFDMNRLFERFMFNMLKKQEEHFIDQCLQVSYQKPVGLWEERRIFADIFIEYQRAGMLQRIIIDAKWKKTDKGASIEDLKQMFTYNMQFGASKSILLYPSSGLGNTGSIPFESSLLAPNTNHTCELYFADVFKEDGHPDAQFAQKILKEILI